MKHDVPDNETLMPGDDPLALPKGFDDKLHDYLGPSIAQVASMVARSRNEDTTYEQYYSALQRIAADEPLQRRDGLAELRRIFRTQPHLRSRVVEALCQYPDLVGKLIAPTRPEMWSDSIRVKVAAMRDGMRARIFRSAAGVRRVEVGDSKSVAALSCRTFRMSLFGFVGVVGMFLIGITGGLLPPEAAQAMTNGVQAAAALGAGVLCWVAAGFPRRGRPTPHGTQFSRFWWLCGAACLSWGAGQVVWTWYEHFGGVDVPFPSLADVGYFPAVFLFAAALFAFPLGRTARRVRFAVDGLIITASLLGISWNFVLSDVVSQNQYSWGGRLLALYYPIFGVVNATIALALITQSRVRQMAPFALTATGILVFAVADSGFLYLTQQNAYHSGSIIDLGWIVAFLLISLAAVHPARQNMALEIVRRIPVARQAVPYAALTLSVVVATWRQVTTGSIGEFLFFNGVAVLILISIRQIVLMKEASQLAVKVEEVLQDNPVEARIGLLRDEASALHANAMELAGVRLDRQAITALMDRVRKIQEGIDTLNQKSKQQDMRLQALVSG